MGELFEHDVYPNGMPVADVATFNDAVDRIESGPVVVEIDLQKLGEEMVTAEGFSKVVPDYDAMTVQIVVPNGEEIGRMIKAKVREHVENIMAVVEEKA